MTADYLTLIGRSDRCWAREPGTDISAVSECEPCFLTLRRRVACATDPAIDGTRATEARRARLLSWRCAKRGVKQGKVSTNLAFGFCALLRSLLPGVAGKTQNRSSKHTSTSNTRQSAQEIKGSCNSTPSYGSSCRAHQAGESLLVLSRQDGTRTIGHLHPLQPVKNSEHSKRSSTN